MRNEDRVPYRTRQRRRRNINWDNIIFNSIIGLLVIAFIGGVITGLVYLAISSEDWQSSYEIEFCNLNQNDLDYLMNGSTNDPAINCSITEQWFSVTTITCKTKGLQNDVTEFINMGNISCWRYKDN